MVDCEIDGLGKRVTDESRNAGSLEILDALALVLRQPTAMSLKLDADHSAQMHHSQIGMASTDRRLLVGPTDQHIGTAPP